MRALDTLTRDERVLLRRIAEEQLVFRGCRLVWVGETDEGEVADRERELLRGLWRGGSIELPEGPEEERVTLTRRGSWIVRELQVFGEPPTPLANEGPLTDPRDLLGDLDKVLGDEPVPASGERALNPSVSVADRVAEAFHAVGLGEVLFLGLDPRDGDTARLLVQLCCSHGRTANDAVQAQGAIARHLGVPEEGVVVRHVPDRSRVELTVRGTGSVGAAP